MVYITLKPFSLFQRQLGDKGESDVESYGFTDGYKADYISVQCLSLEEIEMAKDNYWTQVEIEAAVRAYLEMLEQEIAGQPYNKAATNRSLREGELSGRSRGSIEMRMCNISTVLNDQGRRYIDGYKPRQNVGPNVYPMIESAIERMAGSVHNQTEQVGHNLKEDLDAVVDAVERTTARRRGQGFSSDPKFNRAVELRAMDVVRQHGKQEGWGNVEDTSANRPYDFVFRNEYKMRFVEVKGTTGDGEVVTVTFNEVEHADDSNNEAVLAVVSNIGIERDGLGELIGTGGTLRIVEPWRPSTTGHLKAIAYRYTLPTPDEKNLAPPQNGDKRG